jgi:hypothetical protein
MSSNATSREVQVAVRELVDLHRVAHNLADGSSRHFASQCGPCRVLYRVDAKTMFRWLDSIDVSDDPDTA